MMTKKNKVKVNKMGKKTNTYNYTNILHNHTIMLF